LQGVLDVAKLLVINRLYVETKFPLQ